MALARVLNEHEGALRADFQHYFGLDIDRMGVDYSALHAADLAANLPEGSRVLASIDPQSVWTSDRSLMAAMVNDLNWLVWAKTKDGQHNRNRPRIVGVSEQPGERKIVGMAMEPDELLETIGKIKEAAHG